MTAPDTIQQGTDNGALLVFLRPEEAEAVAKLCKRLSRGRVTQYRLADSKEEARTMMAGLDAIRNVLLEHGFGDLRQAQSRRQLAAAAIHTAGAAHTYTVYEAQESARDDKTVEMFDQAGRAA